MKATFIALALALCCEVSNAQTYPDPAQLRAQAQQTIQQQSLQTWQSNTQLQFQLQQNQARQQHLFNTIPQPVFRQPGYIPPLK